MKKTLIVLAIIGALLLLPTPGQASPNTVDDQAGLLTDEQIQALNAAAEDIESKAKASVFILTNRNNQEDSTTFADLYMEDKIGSDENGITFYIDMRNRRFILSTSGNMIDYMDDSRIDSTLDAMSYDMSAENYYQAAQTFLTKVSNYVAAGVPKDHYRIDSETGKISYYKRITLTEGLIAFGAAVGLTALFVGMTTSRYRLKNSVYAYPYRERSSLELTATEDTLTNSFVTQRRIPRNNSSGGGGRGGGGRSGGSTTHRSGGGTFGGGGRSF